MDTQRTSSIINAHSACAYAVGQKVGYVSKNTEVPKDNKVFKHIT